MKKYLLAFLIIGSTTTQAFAAICACDAPPSCGAKPTNCFSGEADQLVGKTFVENAQSFPKKIVFAKQIRASGVVEVSYQDPRAGNPGGQFYAVMSSENSFNLILTSALNGQSTLVDHFRVQTSAKLISQKTQTSFDQQFVVTTAAPKVLLQCTAQVKDSVQPETGTLVVYQNTTAQKFKHLFLLKIANQTFNLGGNLMKSASVDAGCSTVTEYSAALSASANQPVTTGDFYLSSSIGQPNTRCAGTNNKWGHLKLKFSQGQRDVMLVISCKVDRFGR